jgi:hypothetical protein
LASNLCAGDVFILPSANKLKVAMQVTTSPSSHTEFRSHRMPTPDTLRFGWFWQKKKPPEDTFEGSKARPKPDFKGRRSVAIGFPLAGLSLLLTGCVNRDQVTRGLKKVNEKQRKLWPLSLVV